jgi:hypothetical protein
MSIINRSQIPALMYVGAAEVFGEFDTFGEEWKRIYKTFKSNKAQEFFIEMAYPGYAQIVDEGTAVGGSTIEQRYITNLVVQTVEQNFTMSMEAFEDNQYPDAVPRRIESLRDSLVATQNEFAFALFNTAFSNAFPIADGKALCAIDHPTNGGNVSNIIPGVDPSELSLESAYILSQSMLTPGGLKFQTKPDIIMASHKIGPTISRLINSAYSPSSNINAINVANYATWFPGGTLISHYLDNVPNSAFLLMKNANSFVHINRKDMQYGVHTNPDNRAIKMSAWHRYAYGAKEFRGVVGIQGTA